MAEKETKYTFGYSKHVLASHTSRTAEADAAFLLPHIKQTDKILDVGCGPGTITAGFATYASKGTVIGVDLSEVVLDTAKAHVAKLREDGAFSDAGEISFKVGDVLKRLPFPDGMFDVVYSNQLFPHLPLPDIPVLAATEMRRVLKPGGILASRATAEIHYYPRRLGLTEPFNKMLKGGSGVGDFVGAELPAVLRKAGFDMDGELGRRAQVGAGVTVYSTPETRRWWATSFEGRLVKGQLTRQSWEKAGFSDTEIQETVDKLREWMDTEDAWFVCLQSEILTWK